MPNDAKLVAHSGPSLASTRTTSTLTALHLARLAPLPTYTATCCLHCLSPCAAARQCQRFKFLDLLELLGLSVALHTLHRSC